MGLALSPLGDRRAQSRPAVRPVHRRAARRRPAAQSQSSTRWSPPGSIATRSPIARAAPIPSSSATSRCSIAPPRSARSGWAHRGLRAVPQPQVRSDQPEGVLPALRVLQHAGRSRISRRRCRANSARTWPPGRSTTASGRRCWRSTRSPRTQADWEAKLRDAALHPGEHDDWDFAYGEFTHTVDNARKVLFLDPAQAQRSAAERDAR